MNVTEPPLPGEGMTPTPRLELTVSQCRSCDADIVWVVTARGKDMPIDAKPDPAGAFVLTGSRRATKHGLSPSVVYLREGDFGDEPRYMSHFATCPNAAQHRR